MQHYKFSLSTSIRHLLTRIDQIWKQYLHTNYQQSGEASWDFDYVPLNDAVVYSEKKIVSLLKLVNYDEFKCATDLSEMKIESLTLNWSVLANAELLHLSEYAKDLIHIIQILSKFTSST